MTKFTVPARLMGLSLLIVACSVGTAVRHAAPNASHPELVSTKLPAGNAARGEQIFLQQPCHICHMDQQIGPAFPGNPPLAVRAGSRRPGYSAEMYLRESIVAPDAFTVPGFQPGIMPGDFGKNLSDQQIADLIAYLMTLQ